MSRELDQLKVRIAAILPPGWRVRYRALAPNVLEIYHLGDAGGGLVIYDRTVTMISPSCHPNGEQRGPVGQQDELGEFRGRFWQHRCQMRVLDGIKLFRSTYPYALPSTWPEVIGQ